MNRNEFMRDYLRQRGKIINLTIMECKWMLSTYLFKKTRHNKSNHNGNNSGQNKSLAIFYYFINCFLFEFNFTLIWF